MARNEATAWKRLARHEVQQQWKFIRGVGKANERAWLKLSKVGARHKGSSRRGHGHHTSHRRKRR
jgi:hypothetical protein